jgi:hypothetical protein
MAAEPWTPSVPNDPTALVEIVDTLSNILAQLTTINKRLKLRGEAIAPPDQVFEGTAGTTTSASFPAKPIDKNGQASVALESGGKDNVTDGFLHLPGSHHRDGQGELRNSFHQPKLNFLR